MFEIVENVLAKLLPSKLLKVPKSPTKYCKDCIHYKHLDDCNSPNNLKIKIFEDQVFGPQKVEKRSWYTASVQRKIASPFDRLMNACGIQGRWFEKKVADRDRSSC